jgi:hypothetical protein
MSIDRASMVKSAVLGAFLIALMSVSCGKEEQPPNVSARKVEVSVTGGKLRVKDLDSKEKTTLECPCPCSAAFEGDKVTYSCK